MLRLKTALVPVKPCSCYQMSIVAVLGVAKYLQGPTVVLWADRVSCNADQCHH